MESIQMKTDLSEATFIIPIRIESPDRLRNVVTTTAFLVENFDTNIINFYLITHFRKLFFELVILKNYI